MKHLLLLTVIMIVITLVLGYAVITSPSNQHKVSANAAPVVTQELVSPTDIPTTEPTAKTQYIYIQPTAVPTQAPQQVVQQNYQQPVYQYPTAQQVQTYQPQPTTDNSQYNSCMLSAAGSFSACKQGCYNQQADQSQSGEYNSKQYNDCYFACEQEQGHNQQACSSYPH